MYFCFIVEEEVQLRREVRSENMQHALCEKAETTSERTFARGTGEIGTKSESLRTTKTYFFNHINSFRLSYIVVLGSAGISRVLCRKKERLRVAPCSA